MKGLKQLQTTDGYMYKYIDISPYIMSVVPENEFHIIVYLIRSHSILLLYRNYIQFNMK